MMRALGGRSMACRRMHARRTTRWLSNRGVVWRGADDELPEDIEVVDGAYRTIPSKAAKYGR